MDIFKTIDGKEWAVNDQFSNQDFTDFDFIDFYSSQFDNTVIINACFYQTYRDGFSPPYSIFPSGMKNVRFIACNLDNVQITSEMDISSDGWNKCCNRTVVD